MFCSTAWQPLLSKHLRRTPFFRCTTTMHIVPNMDYRYEAIDHWIEKYASFHPNTRT
jgi:hypothetical protein